MVISYQGCKKRYAKDIVDVILEVEKIITGGNDMKVFSPFFGMGHVEFELLKRDENRIIHGNDLNSDIIEMWKQLQKGWLPEKNCSEKKYNKIKEMDSPSAERGYYLVAFSYGSIFNSGYRPKYQPKEISDASTKYNYNKIKNIVPYLDNFKFTSKSYTKFNPKNKLIYCDPPYNSSKNKMKNKYLKEFNEDEFWETMRDWSKNNIVIISEQSAPKDFTCIWKREIRRKTGPYAQSDSIECLFMYIT